ncbi:LPXTG cell wall anchor domain-containing protein, partial [Bacillus cereus]
SKAGNGPQGGNVKGQGTTEQGGNGSKAGNGSQGGKVKGQGTTEQGGKLPNTATHYPAAILMGITTFLFGITLFVRRKRVK